MTPLDPDLATATDDQALASFWDAVQRVQGGETGRHGVTDADMLAGLLTAADSALLRIIEADGRDLEAARAAIANAVTTEAAAFEGEGIGMTRSARRVAETMFEERRVRGGTQRQEHILLGLLIAGGAPVKAVLATLGIDRARVLRELPPPGTGA